MESRQLNSRFLRRDLLTAQAPRFSVALAVRAGDTALRKLGMTSPALVAAVLTIVLLVAGGPLRAQQPQQQAQSQQQPLPQINVNVKVVNVVATVRDKKDKIVTNLGKDDFVLEEDGHPQTITYFARDTDLPLTLGLLVDTSESQRRVLDEERSASRSFLDDMLREDRDQAFLIHFDRQVELLQDLTSSRDKLEKALELLDGSRPQFAQPGSNGGGNGGNGGGGQNGGYGGGGQNGGRGGQRTSGGTQLYDAVFLASDDVIKKQQGRKALIILSDGVDHGSMETLESAIMTAQRADTVVYAIYFADDSELQSRSPFGFGGGGPFGGGRGGGYGGGRGGGNRFPQGERVDGKKILERIAQETGGRLFEVSKKLPIEDIYSTIAEELRSQYSLGYTPAADVSFGYHKIHLTTKQKDMTVEAREGYYLDR